MRTSETTWVFDTERASLLKHIISEIISSRENIGEAEILRLTRSLNDIGVDSLEIVELVMAMEDEFDQS